MHRSRCLRSRAVAIAASGQATESPVLIELDGVGRAFQTDDGVAVHALRNVSLVIGPGEFVCVTGPSGSGKSTLLGIIGCLDGPTEGVYRYAGATVASLDDDGIAGVRRDEFGFVFQAYNLLEWASARENVELPATYAAVDGTARRRRARELLESMGVGERSEHLPAELSGGERQRVAVARALMNGARTILADEPTGSLDSRHGDEVMALLAGLARRGHAVVVASHDPAVAAHATRRIELRDGRVVSDEPAAVRAMPAASWAPVGRTGPAKALQAVAASIRAALGSMSRTRLRSAFGVLGVTLGIASAVVALGLAHGTHTVSEQVMGRMGADRIQVSDPTTLMSPSVLSVDDARAIENELANVREAVPASYRTATVRHGDRLWEKVGVYAEGTDALPQFMFEAYSVERGAYLTRSDDVNRAQVAVIGAGLRKRLFPPTADPVGETIVIDGVPFTVKGVLAPHHLAQGPAYTPARADDLGTFVYIPFQSAAGLFPAKGTVTIRVFVVDPTRAEETAGEIRDLLFRRHGRGGFGLYLHRERLDAQRDMIALNYAVFGGVAVVALTVGGLGILATMLVSVGQRTREIAIRRVVGARRRDIVRQFLVEASVIGIAGAVVGTPLAFGAGPVIGAIFDSPVAYAGWFLPTALGLAIATALTATFLPASRAARTNPCLALAAD